jgi:hypothetical protein
MYLEKNYIYDMRKIIYTLAIISTISIGFFIQSCNNEDRSPVVNEEIKKIQKSKDYEDFTSVFSSYQQKTIEAINSMSIEERTVFFQNIHNDNFMMAFLKKNNLVEKNNRLQESAYNLVNNSNYLTLKPEECTMLFSNEIFSTDINSIPRLKNGSESGSECEKKFQNDYTILNALTALKIVACTCTVEVPIVACLCYATVMAEHYTSLDKLLRERDECMGK